MNSRPSACKIYFICLKTLVNTEIVESINTPWRLSMLRMFNPPKINPQIVAGIGHSKEILSFNEREYKTLGYTLFS